MKKLQQKKPPGQTKLMISVDLALNSRTTSNAKAFSTLLKTLKHFENLKKHSVHSPTTVLLFILACLLMLKPTKLQVFIGGCLVVWLVLQVSTKFVIRLIQ